MAKYIIEIPDEVPVSDELVPLDMCRPSWYWEAYKKGKAEAEDEVWEFIGHLINVSPSVTEDIYWSINGGKGIEVAVEMSYQEAKAKYDAWKKRKDEIHVGDEVISTFGDKMVVTHHWNQNDGTTGVSGFSADCSGLYYDEIEVEKTGRHFPEVEELLKKLVGDPK